MYLRLALVLVWFISSLSVLGQTTNPVEIYQERTGNGGFDYFAKNRSLAPYQLEVELIELENLKASVPLPYYTVVYPGEPTALFSLKPDGAGSTSFKSGYKLTLGDPNAKIDTDFLYNMPFEHNASYTMVQGANGQYTHQGKYAWDFIMDVGTKVCASRAGVVIEVKEDSNLGGSDQSFMKHANRITILHNDGSYADYAHLKQYGALVEPGDTVESGQVIGYSGNTGWSTRPHLHFQVYKAVKFGIQTLPARFRHASGTTDNLKEQVSYQAVH